MSTNRYLVARPGQGAARRPADPGPAPATGRLTQVQDLSGVRLADDSVAVVAAAQPTCVRIWAMAGNPGRSISDYRPQRADEQ
ncbi:hypothetical protein [Catenuloplanes japonicus]|uniref:hypothetical protein n=1 Tax=Catenuloplanes japonicus TaxID=33876 RepID=UPI0012FA4237|nr:hypothetical protein [Catenuloplanes japonicus]